MQQEQQYAPYPPIGAAEPNPQYAREILSNVGGEDSEMSAVSLYFYNQLLTREHPELSRTFRQVAVTEMRHLEIFGQLALQLGADPRLWARKGRKPVYWSPRYNKYPKRVRQMVSNALYSEYMAVEKYTQQAKAIADPSIVAVLNRVILDEKEHIRVFKDLLRAI